MRGPYARHMWQSSEKRPIRFVAKIRDIEPILQIGLRDNRFFGNGMHNKKFFVYLPQTQEGCLLETARQNSAAMDTMVFGADRG